MVAGIPTSLRFIDLFYSMGVGVLCALAYSALCAVLGVGKRRLFAADLLLFLFSAIVLFSFSVTFSYTGCLRWYMAAGFLLGYWGALWLVAPLAARFGQAIRWVFSLPFLLFFRFALRPFWAWCKKMRLKKPKLPKKQKKQQEETLHKERKVLYNS